MNKNIRQPQRVKYARSFAVMAKTYRKTFMIHAGEAFSSSATLLGEARVLIGHGEFRVFWITVEA